jgi:hypothetical protein
MGPTRCSLLPVTAQVLAMFPVFCGISGSTKTRFNKKSLFSGDLRGFFHYSEIMERLQENIGNLKRIIMARISNIASIKTALARKGNPCAPMRLLG